jgi:hypothetical protein
MNKNSMLCNGKLILQVFKNYSQRGQSGDVSDVRWQSADDGCIIQGPAGPPVHNFIHIQTQKTVEKSTPLYKQLTLASNGVSEPTTYPRAMSPARGTKSTR